MLRSVGIWLCAAAAVFALYVIICWILFGGHI
jgi:hypothetical protein